MTLRRLSTLLIVGGIVLLLEAGLTLLWQEPATAVYARRAAGARSGGVRGGADRSACAISSASRCCCTRA